ncbi:MAG: M28 family peptidase [Saprospiraceae bacterium]|nr:M28 family peptidase [Saprospiraceae bacterium]
MKRQLISVFASLLSMALSAQNLPPHASALVTTVDESNRILTIQYRMDDSEGDAATVVLQQKTGNGAFLNLEEATGDVGEGINVGGNKTIQYQWPSSLDIRQAQFRLFVYDRHIPSIQSMVDQVSEDSLKSYLDSIVGVRHYVSNPGHLIYTAEYVDRFMMQKGLHIGHQFFKYNNIDFPNLIGRHEGLNNQNLCLINAHYDSAEFSPGADDNGTGLAGVLEAIRVMSNYYFENNLQFTSFGNEELGLIGSINYILNGIESDQNILGLINYELIGYYSDQPNTQTLPAGMELLFPAQTTQVIQNQNRGDFILNCGNIKSSELYNMWNSASAQYVPDLKVISLPIPGNGEMAPIFRRSDHAPFWDKGYQALMITDGAETRNTYYHTPNDKVDKLNFDFMTKVVKAGIATLATLAGPLNASVTDIDLSGILRIKEVSGKFSVLIYPNPGVNYCTFNYEGKSENNNFQLDIISSDGSVIQSLKMDKNRDGKYQFDMRKMPKGFYILRIKEGKYIAFGQFVIPDN